MLHPCSPADFAVIASRILRVLGLGCDAGFKNGHEGGSVRRIPVGPSPDIDLPAISFSGPATLNFFFV